MYSFHLTPTHTKKFYICSYGGCGSYLLAKALQSYGKTYHIHSRMPPSQLEFIGKEHGNAYEEWFNGVKIPANKLHEYHVIYIYRNPVKAISAVVRRFDLKDHLKHIQCNPTITIHDVVTQKKDLFGLNDFHHNYTQPSNRNYKIYCVKYEDLFDQHHTLSKALGIGPLNIVKNEHPYTPEHIDTLNDIYQDLNNEMAKNNFITIS